MPFTNLSAGLSATALSHGRCLLSESLLTAHLQNPKDAPRISGEAGPRGRPLCPSHSHILASLPGLWALRISLDAKAAKADLMPSAQAIQNSPTLEAAPGASLRVWDSDRRRRVPSGHPAGPRAVPLRSSLQGTASWVSEPGTTLRLSAVAPEAAGNLDVLCPPLRGGDRNLCSHPRRAGRKWPRSAQRRSPGAVTQMRAGGAPSKPAGAPRQVAMAAGTAVVSSQEAGKMHTNSKTAVGSPAKAPGGGEACPGALTPGGNKTMMTITLTTITLAGQHGQPAAST